MPYTPSGNPDNTNYDINLAAGERGQIYVASNGNRYQVVVLYISKESPEVADGQAAYWVDKNNFVVTNDTRFAVGGEKWTEELNKKITAWNEAHPPAEGEEPLTLAEPNDSWKNSVAGVFRCAVTPGNATHILKDGKAINLNAAANAFVIGDQIVADTAPDTAAFKAGAAPDQTYGRVILASAPVSEPPPEPIATALGLRRLATPPTVEPAEGEEEPNVVYADVSFPE